MIFQYIKKYINNSRHREFRETRKYIIYLSFIMLMIDVKKMSVIITI